MLCLFVVAAGLLIMGALTGIAPDNHAAIVALAVLILVVCLLLLFTGGRKPGYYRRRRHQRYQESAERVLTRLKTLAGDGQRLVYLRKISPYVLEELLLTAFERQGHEVIRNASYSGDGGSDGQVVIDGRAWLIQAKRYRRSISPQHVAAFIHLLESRNQPGFFIHTGRTGPKSRELNRGCSLIHIISGQQLPDLLTGLPLKENFLCMN
ncbi:TPA: restriction endonuclease [Klebsiella oxytoca]|uniref:Restriction endonuclease n=1 Tax=Klebsiella oxytoca TaxID=571 RepID=A0AAN5LB89_KLEOX|nr:restriction endonuclease [Klebsiella oxytoca]